MSIPANISNIKQFVFPQIQCADGSTIQLRLNKGSDLGYNIMTGSLSASLSGSQVCYLNSPHELVEVGTYQLVKHDVDADLSVPQIDFKINDSFLLNGILGNSSGGVTGGSPLKYDFSNYTLSANNTTFLDTVFNDTSLTATYEVYWSRSSAIVPLEIWFYGNVDVNNIPKEIKLVEYPNSLSAVYQNEWQFTAIAWINAFQQKYFVSDLITKVSGWNGLTGSSASFTPVATDAQNIPVYCGQSNWIVPPDQTILNKVIFNSTDSHLKPNASLSADIMNGYMSYNIGIQGMVQNPFLPPIALPYFDPDVTIGPSASASYPNCIAEMSIQDLAVQTITTVKGVDPSNVTLDKNMMFDLYAQGWSTTGSASGFALSQLKTDWSNCYVLQNFLFGFSIGADQSLSGNAVPYLTNFPNTLPYTDPLTTPIKWICNMTGTFIVPRLKTVGMDAVPTVDFIGRRTKFVELPTNWILGLSNEEPSTINATGIIVQNIADDLQILAGTSQSTKTIDIPWRAHKFGPRYVKSQFGENMNNDSPDNLWYWFDTKLGYYQPLAVSFEKKISQQPSSDTPPVDSYWVSDTLTGNNVANEEYKATDKGWVGSTHLLWKSNSSTGVPSIMTPPDLYNPYTIPWKEDFIWQNRTPLDAYYSIAAIVPANTSLPSDERLTPSNSTIGYFNPLIAYAQFYYQEFVGPKITLTQTYQGCTDDSGYISTILPGMHKQEYIHNKLRDFNAQEIEIDPVNCLSKVKWVEQFYNADGTPNANAYLNPPISVVNSSGGSSSSGGGSSNGAPPTPQPDTRLYIKEYPHTTSDNLLQPVSGSVTGITFALSSTGDTSDFIVFKDTLTATTSFTRFEHDGTISTAGNFIAGAQLQPITTVDVFGDFSFDNQITIALAAGQNNNVAIGAHSNIYIIASSDAQISGFNTPQNGKVINCYFDLSPTRVVSLQHENAGSSVPNRLHIETLSDYSITGQGYATFIYDQNETRWIPQSILQGASLTAYLKPVGSPYFIDDTGQPTRKSIVVGGTGTSKDAIAIGAGATASNTSAIAMGWNSTASGSYSFAVNNVDQPNGAFSNYSISIGKDNLVDSTSIAGVVVGGSNNKVLSSASGGVFAGGSNTVTNGGSVILGGGINNADSTNYGAIAGSLSSVLYASSNSFIGAGELNALSSSPFAATIGGVSNTIEVAAKSAIFGGESNTVSGSLRSNILGGAHNVINGAATFDNNIIAGGQSQTITSTSGAFIGTSNTSTINNSNEAAILGGSHNSVTASPFSSIFGSTGSAIYSSNKSMVLGADNNSIINSFESATFNSTSASINSSTGSVIIATGSAGNGVGSISGAVNSFIIGGYAHSITNDVSNGGKNSIGSAIIGGVGHTLLGSNDAGFIGGLGNKIESGDQCIIIGSEASTITDNTAGFSFGVRGAILNAASGSISGNSFYSNILGGQQNIISGAPNAQIHGATVLGGSENTVFSEYGTVAGLGNLVNGFAETRIGYFGKQELGQDSTATAALDLLFAIGNGTGPGSLSDAFTVDNLGRVTATSFTGSLSYFVSKNVDSYGIGTTVNAMGSTYKDNTVIAWAEVAVPTFPLPATLTNGFNVASVTHTGVGTTVLTLRSATPTDINVQVTCSTLAGAPFFACANGLTINTFNGAAAVADANYFITVLGRP